MSHEHTDRVPLIIGHRGAPGYAIEHTERSYRIAMECGVDLIEPDLVPTADGYLLCRHENELSRTTDAKKVRALRDRRSTKLIRGRQHTGWFSEDLTLEELGSLRARERHAALRSHNTRWTDEPLLTLDDTIALVAGHNRERGTSVGLCLELKGAAHFAAAGRPLDDLLLDALARCSADLADVPIRVEADDPVVLRSLASRTGLPTLQLLRSSADILRHGGLEEISAYATGIAVHKNLVVRPATSRSPRRSSRLVERAHRAGLAVHAWTLRSENRYLPPELRTGADEEIGFADPEYRGLLDAGVDAVFSDHPDTAVACRDRWVARRSAVAGSRPQRAVVGG